MPSYYWWHGLLWEVYSWMARPKANAAIDELQMDESSWWIEFDGVAFVSSSADDAIAVVGWCCCVGWCSAWFHLIVCCCLFYLSKDVSKLR